MIRLRKYLIVLCFWGCVTIEVCHSKWYNIDGASVNGPLLEGKRAFETKVGQGFGAYNLLGDEKANILYINNFFPYYGEITSLGWTTRQLGDIFVEKGMLSAEELDIVKQISLWQFAEGVDFDRYYEVLKKFVELGIAYLDTFKLNDGIATLKRILTEIEEKNQTKNGLNSKEVLKNLRSILKNEDLTNKIKPVWKYMHTERLLVFDKFYNVDRSSDGKMELSGRAPWTTLVFVSHLDMCEACKNLIMETLRKMESVSTEKFSRPPHPETDYKILVGSFSESSYFPRIGFSSERKEQNEELLEVFLTSVPSAGVMRFAPPPSLSEPTGSSSSSTSSDPKRSRTSLEQSPFDPPSSTTAAAGTPQPPEKSEKTF